jgi:hypothetical protein
MRLRKELDLEAAAAAAAGSKPPASSKQPLPDLESVPLPTATSPAVLVDMPAARSSVPADTVSSPVAMADFATLPPAVAGALCREAGVLVEAVAEGEAPERAAAVPLIAAALEGAGSTSTEAHEYAEILADAILLEQSPLREVWGALVGSVKAGRRGETAPGQARYLATRLARTSGLDQGSALRHVAILAAAAGVRLRSSSPAHPGSRGFQADQTTTSAALEIVGGPASRAGDKLREALQKAASGAEIRLPGGEFEGPFEITRAVRLRGQGDATTLWMRKGPVVVVKSDGVALEEILIEASEPGGVALFTATGQEPRLSGVTIRGLRESALPAASGSAPTSRGVASQSTGPSAWVVPPNLDFGTVAAGAKVERLIDVETPGPATVVCSLSRVGVEPATLSGGRAQLRLILDGRNLVAGGIFAGALEIVSGTERRVMLLDALVEASTPVTTPPASVNASPSTGTHTQVTSGAPPVRAQLPGVTRRHLAVGLIGSLAIAMVAFYTIYRDGGGPPPVPNRPRDAGPSSSTTARPSAPLTRPHSPQVATPRDVPVETPGGAVTATPSGPGRDLRSVEGRVATQITFVNRLTEPVGVYWIDYQGKEVLYRALQPGELYRQQTYVTHPWVVRHSGAGLALKTIVAGSAEQVVTIDAGSSPRSGQVASVESRSTAPAPGREERDQALDARGSGARAAESSVSREANTAAQIEETRRQDAAVARQAEEQRRREAEIARMAEEQRRQQAAEAARIAMSRADEAQRLRESIATGLIRQLHERGLRDLTVKVDDNRRVVLDGRVDDMSDRERAIRIATEYPGVSSVEVKMRVRREETKKAIEQGKFE